MSLILDALRKLEREKDARAPGILVVGSVPWGETSPARRLALVGLAAAALTLAVGVGWLLRAAPAPPTPVAPPPATASPVAARPAANAPPLAAAPPAPPAALPSAPPIRLIQPGATQSAVLPVEVTPDAATSEGAVPAEAQAAPNPAPERISISPAQSKPDLPAPAPGSDSLRLNAITKRDGRSVALIGDRLVFEGDSFDGVRVIRIGEAEVEVEVRGERRTLRF